MTQPAPGALEIVRAFVNTYDVERQEPEALTGPAELATWLVSHGQLESGETATDGDLRRAIALRDALRAHLRAHHDGHTPDDDAVAMLDATARRGRLEVRFRAADATTLEPAASGVDGALGRLLAIVADAIVDRAWPRLKICAADDCAWAFYDTSRNRSAVWCDMKVCGNRAKVRGFRERARSDTPPRTRP